jgi:AraC-like DNA-binding protein
LSKAGARHAPARVVASQSINARLQPAVERFQASIKSVEDGDPLFISALFELCGYLLGGPDLLRLTNDPLNLPESLSELINAVREEPTAPWPLADAATRAGYSPFHFSRVFKSTVGCGFHEYVERCRTELAIEMLISTNNPVDVIDSSAGFGTPQSLRDSMKEYVGFVPSELRTMSETGQRVATARLS